MDKSSLLLATERNTNITTFPVSYNPKTKHCKLSSSNHLPKHSKLIILIRVSLFLLQIPSLETFPWGPSITSKDHESSMVAKLSQSVTFLPLKDLRYTKSALRGHTWFMSSMNDTHLEGEVTYQKFPSEASQGRILCIKGRDTHDGSWNYYGLAWPEALPHNATLMKGLTFVSYNHYDYGNIWHGLSSVFPFVGWHMKNDFKVPSRWILYHWGELRTKMSLWLRLVLEATFDGPINIERFEGVEDNHPVCFEEAVVMRHNEGGMSRERRMEAFDLMRCKARRFCSSNSSLRSSHMVPKTLSHEQPSSIHVIGMTMVMRTGARSFQNDSAVIDIFRSECAKIQGCRLLVAYSNNLTFCEQVELMRLTDILISPHGAQLTNLFLMDRNSSVMEFFPKGWLELAGVGQYVFRWLASWSGMKHQGAYRDPNGDKCPYIEDNRRCMSFFKNGKIGHNETYFREWARNVLKEVKLRKMEKAFMMMNDESSFKDYTC